MSCSVVDRYQHLEEHNWLHLRGCCSVLLPTDQVTCHNIIEHCDLNSLFFCLVYKMIRRIFDQVLYLWLTVKAVGRTGVYIS
jgi:hypothetical protein